MTGSLNLTPEQRHRGVALYIDALLDTLERRDQYDSGLCDRIERAFSDLEVAARELGKLPKVPAGYAIGRDLRGEVVRHVHRDDDVVISGAEYLRKSRALVESERRAESGEFPSKHADQGEDHHD
jgi:hypothetical protein